MTSSIERVSTFGYNRPRRPNEETLAYLRGLPLNVVTANSEIQNFLEQEKHPAVATRNGGSTAEKRQQQQQQEDTAQGEEDVFPPSLGAALSALDEVKMEIASLAGDEHGSQCLEVLARIALPVSETAARLLLAACSGYHVHLATHRYGSHFLQTLLQLSVSFNYDSSLDLALHPDAPQMENPAHDLATISESIIGMVEELNPCMEQLAIHTCGSHVLRTLLCVLGGVDLVSSSSFGTASSLVLNEDGFLLRGRKKSKHKKRKKPCTDDSEMTSSHAGTMKIVYRKRSRLDSSVVWPQLETLALTLIGGNDDQTSDQPGNLQQLACHSSAGPLLIVLLRVLTYSSPTAREFTEKQQSSTSSSDNNNNRNTDDMSNFRLGISKPEPPFEMGSLAETVAKRLLCWKEGVEKQPHLGDVVYGYSGEPRGSHVLETLLRVSPDPMYETIVQYGDFCNATSLKEYCDHDISNFVIQTFLTTIRTKEMAEGALKNAVEKVIASGLVLRPNRRGILWRAVELAAKFRVGQEGLLKAIRQGFGALNVPVDGNVDDDDGPDAKIDGGGGEEEVSGQKKKVRKKSLAIDMKDCVSRLVNLKQGEDGVRVILDAAGTRSIYHMLRFSPRLCENILAGILEGFSDLQLELLAQDGLGSRCIVDGILEGPTKTPIFGSAVLKLFDKLKGRWVALSTHRVGHHSVRKLFLALPKIDDKAKLVEEIAKGGNRLSGNAMGRSVMEICMVELYNENRKDWRKAVAKKLSHEDNFLKEIEGQHTPPESSDKPNRKRKRKRPGKSTVENREINDDSQAKKSPKLGIGSIIDAISDAQRA